MKTNNNTNLIKLNDKIYNAINNLELAIQNFESELLDVDNAEPDDKKKNELNLAWCLNKDMRKLNEIIRSLNLTTHIYLVSGDKK